MQKLDLQKFELVQMSDEELVMIDGGAFPWRSVVGAIVGAVVGFIVGGPAGAIEGAILGGMAGAAMDAQNGDTGNGIEFHYN